MARQTGNDRSHPHVHHPMVLSLTVLALSSCAPLIHAESVTIGRDTSASASHHANEVIIKVDGPTMAAIDASVTSGTFPRTGLASLDAALSAVGATSARVLFRESPEDYEALNAKFPDRAQRIPQGAAAPAPSATYLLTLADGASVEDAVEVLSRVPAVAYAQPNYVVSTQGGEALQP